MQETEEASRKRPSVKFTYQKSTQFRVIKADGAWGNLSPRGEIVMSLFTERLPMPDTETYSVGDAGQFQLIDQKRSSEGLIREVEVAVHIDPLVAFTIAQWLLRKVEDAQKRLGIEIRQDEFGATEVVDISDGNA